MFEPLRAILLAPRLRQASMIRELCQQWPAPPRREDWNSRFSAGSLYDAWSRTSVMQGVYAANAAALREHLQDRVGWRVVEVGAGNGRLWSDALSEHAEGELWVVDPVAEVEAPLRAHLPRGVHLELVRANIEAVTERDEIPPADAAVCSLSLHHVAGVDTAQRRRHGLEGPGKLEVLTALARSLTPRQGLGLLNEADVFCDLALPPGDPVLLDRIIDSYVRRTIHALIDDLRTRSPSEDIAQRWWAIIRTWCLDQVEVVDRPRADRDVYELDVPRWLSLLHRAGMDVESWGFTDSYGLFCQYRLRPRPEHDARAGVRLEEP